MMAYMIYTGIMEQNTVPLRHDKERWSKWIVLQKRVDATVDFNRQWNGMGFENPFENDWIPMETIHQLNKGKFTVRFNLKHKDGSQGMQSTSSSRQQVEMRTTRLVSASARVRLGIWGLGQAANLSARRVVTTMMCFYSCAVA